MGRRWAIAGLAAVTAVLLGVGLFEGLLETRYGDGGLIEFLAAFVDETKPFGPALLLATLFALLGPARPWHRLVARIVAGLILCVALFWLALIASITGSLEWPNGEDALILSVLLAATALCAWLGLQRDAAPLSSEDTP